MDVTNLIGDPKPQLTRKDLARLKRPGAPRYPKQQHDPHRPIALRTHVEPLDWEPKSKPTRFPTPTTALLVATLTRDEAGEPLDVGIARLITPYGTAQQWAFHGDTASPSEVRWISEWCETNGFDVPLSRTDFAELVLYRVWFKNRPALAAWNPQLEIARLSVDWGDARDFYRGGYSLIPHTFDDDPTARHRELVTGEIEDRYRPRYQVRSLDSVRALMGVTLPDEADRPDRGGIRAFVSIRAMVEAQAGKQPLTLDEACDLYGIDPPVDTGGMDGLAAQLDTLEGLYRKAMRLHRKLLPHRPPNAAMSSGTYAQGILEQQGLIPPLGRQPDMNRGVLAAFMGAFYAGDVGLGVRGPDIPARFLDMSGAYAMAAIHSGIYELLSAKQIRHHRRDPDQMVRYLSRIARRIHRWLEGSGRYPLTPKDWRRLARTVVWVIPSGDLLAHRFWWLESWRMTVALLTHDQAIPFMLADVLASVLRTGQLPTITRGLLAVPWGQQTRQPVTLPNGTVIESDADPFEVMAFERARLELGGGSQLMRGMLKGLINSMASGKPSQFIDDEPTSKPREILAWNPLDIDAGPEVKRKKVIETPGDWYCPQAASGVTAIARLLLTISRLGFEIGGGTIAYWDTDSLLVVATPHGGLVPMPHGPLRTDDGKPSVRALSYREVDEIRWRLEALSPYPAELRPTINTWDLTTGLPIKLQEPRFLRVEPENHPPIAAGLPTNGLRFQIASAKRYDPCLLYEPEPHAELTPEGPARIVEPTRDQRRKHSQILMRGASRHGFTHQAPAGANESWVDQIVASHLARKLEIRSDEPEWAWDPAISLIPVTRPRIGRSIKAAPFSRLSSWRAIFGDTTAITYHYPGLDPDTATWIDAETHHPITPLTGGAAASPDAFIGDTYATAAARLRRTREPTVITPDGQPCNPTTQGIVHPAPTIVTGIALIGRESRRWRNHTPQGQPDHITYKEAETWPHAVATLGRIAEEVGQRPVAKAIGISERTLRNLLGGRRFLGGRSV